MSLVNYGSSDSESSEDESNTPQQLKRSFETQKKKTVYVDLPVPDEEEEEHRPKRTKISSGLGLADLLPAPKNSHVRSAVTTTTNKESFIPHALTKRKIKEKAKEEEPVELSEKDDQLLEEEKQPLEEEEDEKQTKPSSYTGSFFKFGKSLKEDEPERPVSALPAIGPTSLNLPEQEKEEEEEEVTTAVDAYAYDPNAMYSTDPSAYYYYQQQEQEDTNQMHSLSGIPGIRESNAQIKDVNQRDILPTNEWREQQALTATPKFDHGISMQASKLQMKKNNIMALAAHAINNQDKLDEMFAANKKTRREAARKYGF
ncbi:hypothetical protein BD560DRAFT_490660 [Blakeslea trispora]|nr:hypothetical protein BD560DRAFT_490660 [Blakeslea trispora]